MSDSFPYSEGVSHTRPESDNAASSPEKVSPQQIAGQSSKMSDPQTIPARKGIAMVIRKGESINIINTHGTQVIATWAFALQNPHPGSSKTPDPSITDPDIAPLYPSGSLLCISSFSEAANASAKLPEYMSMPHTRAKLRKLTPTVGDTLFSQKGMPMLKLVKDTSPGVHDTLVAACDRWRNGELGAQGYHNSCTDNCWDALDELVRNSKPYIPFQPATATRPAIPEQPALPRQPKIPDKWIGSIQTITKLGGRIPDPLNLFMNVPVAQGDMGAKRSLSFEAPMTRPGDYVRLEALRPVLFVMSACPQDMLPTNGEKKKPTDAHFEILESEHYDKEYLEGSDAD